MRVPPVRPRRRRTDRVVSRAATIWNVALRLAIVYLGVWAMAYAIRTMHGGLGSARWAVGISGFWAVGVGVTGRNPFDV